MLTRDNWDLNMSVNARAPFRFLSLAVPHLKKGAPSSSSFSSSSGEVEGAATSGASGGGGGGGSVVNVSSVNGMQSFGGCVSYCASKAALDMVLILVYSLSDTVVLLQTFDMVID